MVVEFSADHIVHLVVEDMDNQADSHLVAVDICNRTGLPEVEDTVNPVDNTDYQMVGVDRSILGDRNKNHLEEVVAVDRFRLAVVEEVVADKFHLVAVRFLELTPRRKPRTILQGLQVC
ncbi:MAG: hypothetical protein Q7R79_01495 [bacterium]|nr:hypothetical protein [bacterium]